MFKVLRLVGVGVFVSCLGITNGFAGKPVPKSPTADLYLVLLPAAASTVLGCPFETCRGMGALLKIPDLQGAQTGVVGIPSLAPEYPKANSVYYYFFADSNHDGTFDTGYNLVWQSGIYLTRTEYSDRTVYDLTTDLTSPNAELIQGVGNGGTSKGVFCVPLRLMVTRLK